MTEIAPVIIWKTATNSVLPSGVTFVKFKVFSPEKVFKDTIVKTFPYSNHSGILSVPSGLKLVIVIEGLNSANVVIYHGSITLNDASIADKSITIEASQVTPIAPAKFIIQPLSPCSYQLSWKDLSANDSGFLIYHRNSSGVFNSIGKTIKDTTISVKIIPITAKYQIFKLVSFNTVGSSNPVIDSVETPITAALNLAPVFLQDSASISDTCYLSQTRSMRLLAFDPNCDVFTFTASPPLSLRGDTIKWMPTIANIGLNNFSAYVADVSGKTDTLRWTWTVIDTIRPLISIYGKDTLYLAINDKYYEPGATATDNIDKNVSKKIIISGTVNVNIEGIYHLTYNVTDMFNNKAPEKKRTVYVFPGAYPDGIPPIIKLIGRDTVIVEANSIYVDSGAIALDNRDDSLTAKIQITSTVATIDTGFYAVTYNVKDNAGNAARELVRYVIVKDRTRPVLTLIGKDTVIVDVGSKYADSGAKSFDSLDGDISSKITVSGNVSTIKPGTFVLTFSSIDHSGNLAQITRTVIVKDLQPPVITLIGADTVHSIMGSSYRDSGATAYDSLQGVLTSGIIMTNNIDSAHPGFYQVIYNIKDSSGNSAVEIKRIVEIKDTTKPQISIIGNDTITINLGAAFNDYGAVAVDNADGDISDKIKIGGDSLKTAVAGLYTRIYSVKDSSGNSAQTKRIITVIDTVPPVLKLNSGSILNIPSNMPFVNQSTTKKNDKDSPLA
jgi:hypothetical protein